MLTNFLWWLLKDWHLPYIVVKVQMHPTTGEFIPQSWSWEWAKGSALWELSWALSTHDGGFDNIRYYLLGLKEL